MSISEGTNLYGSPQDFQNHYPALLKHGYHTAYECIGLSRDPSIPITLRWGYLVQHTYNMRYRYDPHQRYYHLLNILKDKNYFVLTSNIDGCFERAGFDVNRLYTPQGDFSNYQCSNAKQCTRETYPSKPFVDALLPKIKDSSLEDVADIPKCTKCNKTLFANLRGGDWFIHDAYLAAQIRFESWVDQIINSLPSKPHDPSQVDYNSLLVVEIGAGWNTPIVTRYPAESIAREIPGAAFIRINPTDWQVPDDLVAAVELDEGADVISSFLKDLDAFPEDTLEQSERNLIQNRLTIKPHNRIPKVDWRQVLKSLR
eukprot:TRINITY_DN2680_c0_g1_i1.p1 TRINITY_DN2680_c0_g1~~TRINITY_DN2680_c0_g1_i1.p1  ORF type:complete len:351 (-),score=73.67 TRINITY_DN2680_c0_g1_i1:45-986(-)